MSSSSGMGRALGGLAYAPRKRITTCLLMLLFAVFTIIILVSANSRLIREEMMEQHLAEMQSHLLFLDSQYRARHEDIITLQAKSKLRTSGPHHLNSADPVPTVIPTEVVALLRNLTGTRAAAGFQPKVHPALRTPFIYQLLPHLMTNKNSLQPAYHMKAGKSFAEVVVGIPTVKRDKENYLMITLMHLIDGLTEADYNTTLIVVMVGETDLQFVINTARHIENTFPKQVENGMIEVISPSPSYYPNFDQLPLTLGDPMKRVKWRTKQNLDAIYLMAYAQSKGMFYLMLEDDVIAKKNYMHEIKQFTAATTVATPGWFLIEYCHIGGIGKLFRSSDLLHFITYVQLFYNNMPIDWLIESYLADRTCALDRSTKICGKNKLKIRPKYKTSLFQHIGLYSSLKGKIQKIRDSQFGALPTFYPHENPPLISIKSDILASRAHTVKRAYDGLDYFWGVKPKKGDVIEFCFTKPRKIERFLFRSGNAEHVSDKFYDAVVEVLPVRTKNYSVVGTFDEFGLCDGELKKEVGPVQCIRIRVGRNSDYWVVLSEIDIKMADSEPR